MRKIVSIISIFLLSLSFSFCIDDSTIENIIKKMTLQEKIGQLFVVSADVLQDNSKTDKGLTYITDESKEIFKKYPVGGIVYFGNNIESPQQIKKLNSQIHLLNWIKTFTFIDEEGGSISRLANNSKFNLPSFPDMLEIGKNNDFSEALNVGKTIGNYLNELCFDVDFAPVADVFSNPNNPAIGKRAFSSDPQIAGNMAVNYSNGLNEIGIKSCYKHFPGHGDTKSDTHLTYTECLKTKEDLYKCELIPFMIAIQNNPSFIMASHISFPNVTGNKLPASLSKELLTDILRNEMGYEGIIITDSMNMKAITNYYSVEEAAVLAINAGVDIILMPQNLSKAFDSILNAVINNEITEERINESVYRILKVKYSN